MYVSELWLYPIKSCRGIAVDTLDLDERGARGDRRWMLVAEDGRFISQRTTPRLTLVNVQLLDGAPVVSAPGLDAVTVTAPARAALAECIIWDDQVALRPAHDAVSAWFSELLGTRCRLMYMPDQTERAVDAKYSPQRRLVSLADAFPLLLIGQGSLDLLNEKLAARGEPAVPMKRFRPNVVVSGAAPHAEDAWKRIRLGTVPCSVVKPCARCVTTTVDVDSGEMGKEPLRTLAEYRKVGSKVMFGQNLIHDGTGSIYLGDPVTL